MEFIIYGINFEHKPNEFCDRANEPLWFISCFHTDFLYEKDGKLLKGNAGDILIHTPGYSIYHGPYEHSEKGFVNDWVFVSGNEISEILKKYPLPLNTAFSVGGSNYLANAINNIHKERSYAICGHEDKCDMIFKEAIIDLYRAYVKTEKNTIKGKFEYARGEIIKDYKRNWSLKEMAELIGYSTSRFSAVYKNLFSISPVNDLINARLENAKLLLVYGNMSVSEVSEAVGFSNIYYFSKYFKYKEGISPSEFLKRIKSKESEMIELFKNSPFA